MRYIEMNPVAAGIVDRPEQYKWSSYMANAWGRSSSITPHDEYLNLGHRVDMRCRAYRELFQSQLPDGNIHLIERASEYCQRVGDDRFRKAIEQRYGIKLGQAARGRPRKRVTTG